MFASFSPSSSERSTVVVGSSLPSAPFCERPHSCALVGERATLLAEEVLNFLHRAVAVVGVAFDDDGDAAGAVGLVDDLLELFAGGRSLLYRAVDVVGGHILGTRLVYRCAQSRRIAVALGLLRLDGNKAHELGKHLALPRIGRRLLVLNFAPLAVSRHASNILAQYKKGR
jgi:hypothetical protein